MGRDWLYWGGGGGGGSGSGGRSSSSTTKRANNTLKEGLQRNTPSGCMSAVFQLFDFHQLQFCLHKHDLPPPPPPPLTFLIEEQPNVLNGLEAPRNSLEIEGASTNTKEEEEEEALNIIPMAIQIKTRSVGLSSSSSSSKARTDQDMSSSECSTSSPGGSKTPSLVARLMGLDLLPPPGSSSPSPSTHSNPPPSSKSPHLQYLKQEFQNRQRINQFRSANINKNNDKQNFRFSVDNADVSGTRSLPDTPRTSSSSRRSVESRLSLQINNKENVDLLEFSGTRSAGRRRRDDIGRSPSQYAREIVKQVKERVGRKVGADITNRNGWETDDVVLLKTKKPLKPRVVLTGGDDQHHSGSPSCSPRLIKSNQLTSNTPLLLHSPKLPLSPLSIQVVAPPGPPPPPPPAAKAAPPKPNKPECKLPEQKCKKVERRYGARLKKKKQEEQFVRSSWWSSPAGSRSSLPDQKKKSKKTPLSSELLIINVPVKKNSSPSPSPSPSSSSSQTQSQVSDAITSKRSTQLPNCTYNEDERLLLLSSPATTLSSSSSTTVLSVSATRMHAARGSRNGRRTPTGGGGGADQSQYFHYIREMLTCTGINVNTPLSSFLINNKCWYYSDPAHPLDPPIFNHLERSCPTTDPKIRTTELTQRCNRRLIFDLTNEILSEMLRPRRRDLTDPRNGFGLIEVICTRIASFPAADCTVLEDIDALIERDFCGSFLCDEDELIVSELENELVDSLVHETVMWVVFGGDKKV